LKKRSDCIDKLPGFLNYEDGFEVLHADWPNYPLGHGWEIALKTIGNFPEDTFFYEIDDIDYCKLFVSTEPTGKKDILSGEFLHIASWHEDLIALKNMNLIEGVYTEDDLEYQTFEFERFKKMCAESATIIEDQEGNFRIDSGSFFKRPDLKSIENEIDSYDLKRAWLPNKRFKLNNRGIECLKNLVKPVFHIDVNQKITPLLQINYYDTAVRELALMIEYKLKSIHFNTIPQAESFGLRLINYHIKFHVENSNGFYSALLKVYNSELKTAFKYVRNEFMHNYKDIDYNQCIMILDRLNSLYCMILDLNEDYLKKCD